MRPLRKKNGPEKNPPGPSRATTVPIWGYHRGVNLVKGLTLIGGVSLLVGLVAALVSNRYTATKGLLVAKNPLKQGGLAESPKDHAECWFYIGLSLTAVGVILQTLGSLLPP